MAQIRRSVLASILFCVALTAAVLGQVPKFLPDDPVQVMPKPMPFGNPRHRSVDALFDFLVRSKHPDPLPPTPAAAVNTLGEVPDSDWFTNRHARRRLTVAELQQGSDSGGPPEPPFEVVAGKDDGIMAGIRFVDANGRTYFVKGDPVDSPEMATAAEAIVSRFLYAIGYNTPRNDVIYLKASDLRLSKDARITGQDKRSRKMTEADISEFLKRIAAMPDRTFRCVASLAVPGDAIGPFRYEGTRSDDPNDVTPHQDRRDLRGLHVFSAWLNNTDTKAGNTFDTVIEENGVRFIRHYLIDFGSALGSDGDRPKDARFGHEFMLPTPSEAAKTILSLGAAPKDWERINYPKLRGVGRFEYRAFEPDAWRPDYPNPAFLSRLPDDDFWAAKQVMAFTNDDIRAIVETGKFSDPAAAHYIVSALAARRDKIGRTFFAKVLPLDEFRVERDELRFDDLGARYGFDPGRNYSVQWSLFNNLQQKHELIPGADSFQLPVMARQASPDTYFCAAIQETKSAAKAVKVYVRKDTKGYKVVGVDRSW